MKVLVACEYSGRVRDAFIAKGHEAMSCDLLPTDVPGPHYQGDIFDVLDGDWDLMVAHPPCTYLTVSGNRWFKPEYADRYPTRHQDRLDGIDFFLKLYDAPIPKIAVENPVGIMSTEFRKPDQYIQPYEFGDPQSKKTGLWLKNLPKLQPTKRVEPEFYIGKDGRRDPMWHFESLGMDPVARMKHRSQTFQGIADAMADQWS
jgi:hypothetical protein